LGFTCGKCVDDDLAELHGDDVKAWFEEKLASR